MKIIFIDKKHKNFFLEKVNQMKKTDSYTMSLLYLLSMTDETRSHFEEVFDIKEKGINFDALDKSWQTGTTSKVTKLAFNLWNGYSGDESSYSVDNIFSCVYAPYFYQAIKLRYPSYTEEADMEELSL